MVKDVSSLAVKVLDAFASHDKKTAFTVAISGIDAAGKGFITKVLQKELEQRGLKVANINIDPWQNPIAIRLQKENAAENFYENVFRWNDFFETLIFPLKNNKRIYLLATGVASHADEFSKLIYDYKNIDIILIDGILLLKKKYLCYYDYKIWIDCSFETGMKRAIKRNVERLSESKLIHDYNTFYYAAQRLHFELDYPQHSADLIFHNDLSPVLSDR